MWIAYILLFISISIFFVFLFFLLSLVWTTVAGGIPYLPTNTRRVKQIIDLAHIQKGEKAVDLGSGDGRIVIALAQAGAEAHGLELNVFYVLLSRYNIYKAGLRGKAFIHWKNFFHVDLSSYDVITGYCISYLMRKLEMKLQREIKPKTRVVTTSYAFKTWQYSKRIDHAFLYKKQN